MAFIDPNCRAVATKAANGKLTEQEILDVFARIDERARNARAQGQTGVGDYMKKWAAEEGERAKIAAAMQARHAALNVIIREKVDRQVAGMIATGLAPHQAIRAVLEGINSPAPGSRASAAANVQAYEARYLGGFFADLEREKPHIAKLLADPKLDADTLTEMWELRKGGKPGSTKNADAQWLAKKFADYAEMSRTDLNRLGASIGKLDGWAGVQSHDPIKMMAVGKDAWVGRISALLDHERSFPEAPTATESIDILRDIYDTIITGVPNKQTAAELGQRVNPANMAKSLGASRVLHFQDGKAALDYREQFGYGNTISSMFSHLRHMAHVGGAMETLGPNPEIMFRSIAAGLERNIRNSTVYSDADKVKLIGKLNTDAGTLKHAIDVTTGLVSRPVNVTAAKIGGDIRAFQSMGKLGTAVISSLGDTVTTAAASAFRGSGFYEGLVRQLGGVMKGRPKGEQAEISYLFGEGFDGLIGHIVNQGFATDGVPGKLGAMQEGFFKWTGLTWWTDVNRAVAARTIGAELGMRAGTAYADLPAAFRHVLGQAGIDDPTWGVLGKTALRMDNGKPYMTPDRVRELSDADLAPLAQSRIDAVNASRGTPEEKAQRIATIIGDTRRQLEVKVLSYIADQTSYAVIESDARTRRYATAGFRPGTLAGELARMVMQFKSYPLAFTTRVFGRELYGQRKEVGALSKAANIAQVVAGLTVAGYMSMVAKDMLKGYWPPRNPADPRTVLAALQQGGGFGIYGDYLFSKVNRFGGGLLETALGPAVGQAGQAWDIYNDARDAAVSGGQDPFSMAQAFSTISSNVPYANLHVLKPVLDYLIVNSIREALSPGYMKGMAKNRMRDYGQASAVTAATGKPALDPLNIARGF